MRIIGGKHRGRPLLAPEGRDVRPTSDRAREALFNILSHGAFAAEGAPYLEALVLDVFAGTGAFGLEALSRGAARAHFIEKDRKALGALKSNIDLLGEAERTRIFPIDATKVPPAAEPAALAFLDPPYESDLIPPTLHALADQGWIAQGALCIAEIGAREDLAPQEGFERLDERRYGAAKVILLRFGKSPGSGPAP